MISAGARRGDEGYAAPASGKPFAAASALFFGLGLIQAVSQAARDLPMPQPQNTILIVLGAVFLVAFFVANEPDALPE